MSPPVSNITNERLAAIIANPVEIIGITEGLAMAREILRLRASAPVLSEEQREALEAGAGQLERAEPDDRFGTNKRAQAALLRAIAKRGSDGR